MGIRHSSYPVYSHKIGGFSKQCFLDTNISIKVSKQNKRPITNLFFVYFLAAFLSLLFAGTLAVETM